MFHTTRPRRGGRALVALAAFALLQSASVGAATVSWDGGGDGASWSDPLNWSGDVLPGPDDTAVLNVAAEPAVVLTGPAVTVAVLDCRETLTLAGDGLTVTGAATVRSHVLRLEGGSLSTGGLTVIDGAFEQAGGAVAGDVTLVRGRLALAAGTSAGVTFHLRGTGTFTGELPTDAIAALEGSVAEGLSRWTVEGEWRNRGTVRLTSVTNDLQDRGAYLAVPDGALFRNLPGGRIVAVLGTGDARRINGPLLNEGIVEAMDVELQYRGALESRGGRHLGDVRILDSDLVLTGAPPEPTTLLLHGTGNRLLSDVPEDTILQINGDTRFGLSRLTLPVGVGNSGTFRLTCSVNDLQDRSAELVVAEGTLTNRAAGRIEVLLATGDSRRFTGNLRNEGIIDIEAGITFRIQGVTPHFTQAAGSLAASGEFLLESGNFDHLGGVVTGTVRGHDCRFWIGPGIADPSILRAVGGGGIFAGNASPAVTLWLEGRTTWGGSRLTIDSEVENHGILLMRSTNGDLQDQSSYLTVVGDGILRNRATGRIVAEEGSGDRRRIDGRVANAGSIEADNISIEFRGQLESAGGSYVGDVRFLDTDLRLTEAPGEPTTLFLYAGGNRLLTDVPERTTLEVRGTTTYGLALLTVPEGVGSDGILRLTCTSNDLQDRSARITVADGVLTNRSGGRIEVWADRGDGRILTGNLRNEGMIEIESGITLTQQGEVPVFTQAAGSLVAGGQFLLEAGTFHLAGGEVSGLVRVRNSRVRTDAAAVAPGTVRMVGAGNVLERHEAREVALWIEGTTTWGLSRLTVPASTVSAGTIHLTTTSNDLQDRGSYLLVEPGMTLTNTPSGRITAEEATGDSRNLTGHLWHQGAIEIGPGTALNVYERLDLDGGSVGGEIRLFNTDIATWRPAVAPSVLPLYGTGNRLVGDVHPGYTVWVRGTTSWGLARLTAPEGFVNRGTIRLETASNDLQDRSSHLTVTAGVLRNAVDGRIEILPGAGDGRQVAAELWNEGVLQVATGASLGRTGAGHVNTGTIRIEGGATLTVSGSGLEQSATGRLEGVGTLDVQAVAYADAGTVSPGASPGTLTIRGAPAFGPSHRLELEAAGVEPGVSLDRLAVDGTARLDGTLRLVLTNDFVPAVGDLLPVLTFTGVRGAYGTVELPPLPADRAWLPEYTTGAFRLSVIDAADATNRPPSIVAHPVPVTVVKGRTAEFFVTANGTGPLGFQWQRDGEDLDGETAPVLALTGVQPEQAGTYRVVVSNEVGTATSDGALLTVLPAVGTLIPVEDAFLAVVPAIGGDGVEVDVYNGIGGGRAPTFEDLEGLSPTGSTPSPFIDFPRPGNTIAVGTSFDTFFADTTTPPASLSSVAAANFLLDHEFLLKVDPADDLHPDTPEVDIDLGVGSDDGFRLRVGSVELGSAGDRGFQYSWYTVSFPTGGLYPVRLLFAANAVGASGLEFSWRTARSGQQVVPQDALYRGVPLGDRLVTFDDLDPGVEVAGQYAAEGVVFSTLAGNPRVTADDPDRLVPVSPPHVLGEPDPLAEPFAVEFTFVTPDGGFPGATPFVSFFVIDAEEGGVRVEAFDGSGTSVFDEEFHGGAAAREQVVIGSPQIARVRVTQLDAADPVAIDHLSFATPFPLNLPPVLSQIPDVTVDEGGTAAFQAEATDPDEGQTVRFSLRAGGPAGAAIDPLTGEFAWNTSEIHGPGEYVVVVVATDDGEPPQAAEQEVAIAVREVNLPPTLQPFPPQYVSADSPLVVDAVAFDPDLPAQVLTFALGAGAPAGMTIDPITGRIAWAPDRSVPAGTYAVEVGVVDDQVPPLGAVQPLEVWVDHAGPRVVSMTPSGEVGLPVATIDLHFDRDLLASSVSVSDVSVTGPSGPIPPVAVERPAPDVLRIRLPEQRQSGAYTVEAGPGILGLNRAPMDQDGDGITGESDEDVFRGGFNLSLPDLVVTEVTAPSTGAPGESVVVTWRVTNLGAAAAVAPWFEAVRLSADELPGGDTGVTDLRIAEPLAPGASLVRTQSVVLPFTGAAGDLRFVVVADANGTVPEESEANNAAVATVVTRIAPGLSLQPARSSVAEGEPAFQVIVRRNGDLSSPLEVALAAEPAGELGVPDTVVLPAGQASATFLATPLNDGVVDGDRPVALTATADGFLDGTAGVEVRDVNVPLLRLELASGSVSEGRSVTATVRREPLTPGALTVRLDSRNPAQLRVPTEVVIADGEASATFDVTAVDDGDVEDVATVDVTASAEGFVAATAPVGVADNDAPILRLTVTPSVFSEGDGPTAATATLTRQPAGAGALRVALASTEPTAARVPSTVTLPGGAASVTFPVSAVDDIAVDGPQGAEIVVSWIDAPTGRVFGEAVRAAVTVTDDDSAALSVDIDRDVVAEGLSPAALVRIRGNQPTDAPVTVTLTSSDPGEAVVPVEVILASGDQEVVVALDSVDDGVPDGNQTVTVTASAAGFVSGSDVVVVSDIQLPDLVIESLTGPSAGRTLAPFQVTFREVNRGLAAASGEWRQALYLSADPLPGDDLLLGTVGFTGTLAPGLYFERTLQFRLPAAPGTYWLVAVSDPDNAVSELLEGNNTTVAAVPIEVTPAYTAEVATVVEVAPSGTPVPFTGRAVLAGTETPAPFELVNIHVRRGDTRRVLSALTDAQGRFTASFLPLPGEAGVYTVGAAHPGADEAPVQDTFTLLGMRFDPREASRVVTGPGTFEGGFELRNLSDVPLAGLVAEVTGLPDWLEMDVSVPADLAGDGAVTVAYEATHARDTAAVAEVMVEVRAEGGLLARLPFTLRVQPLVPRLVAVPGRLEAGMLRGEQTLLALRLRNDGGAATGPVSIRLPDFPWMTVASAQPLPSLAPGDEVDVTLRLAPPDDLPLGRYEGSLVASGTGTATGIPFSFLALSTATGTLAVETVDEFTYYAAGSPRLAGASVVVTDELTGEVVTTGVTDADGRVEFPDLREGYHRIEATADGHTRAAAVVLVPAGQTTSRTLFLSRNTVEYRWTVTPTEIEDRTRITVEAVFETVVPAPVVVVEPSVIDFADFTADVSQVDLKVTNHGLIAANDVELDFPRLPDWVIEPLVTELGDLPARSSFTIPVIIRRVTGPDRAAVPAAGGGGCAAARLVYRLVCGPFNNTYSVNIGLHNDGSGCPVGGGGGAWAGGGGGGSGSFTAPRAVSFDSKCGPGPCAAEIGKWAFDCAFSILPLKDGWRCGKGVYDCLSGAASGGATGSTALTCLGTALDCAAAGGKSISPLISGGIALAQCLDGMRSVAECLEKAKKEKEAGGARLAAWEYDLPADLLVRFEELEVRLRSLSDTLVVYQALVGNEAWFNPSMDESFGTWFEAFSAAALPGTPLGERIDLAERAVLTAGPVPPGLEAADLHRLIDRWNRTVDYYGRGILDRSDLPSGENPDFIAFDELLAASGRTRDAIVSTEAAGFDDPVLALQASASAWVDAIEASGLLRFTSGTGLVGSAGGRPAAGPAPGDSGICARVRLRLDQEAVVTRDAFEARLEVENRQGIPLRSLRVTLEIRDADGVLANDRFGIRQPVVTGMGAVDGTGEIPAQTTGTAAWTLIPTSDAAPDGPAVFTVAGRLEYVEEGIAVTIPLAPATIDVLPNASLLVKYFHQRDVLADDPFTPDVVEPSVPYSLGVLVENRGRGEARNVRIASAQPQIVENEKGLLIDFQIIGTEVDGRGLSPSLTVDLGDIAAGDIAIGRWLLTSTLQGQFIEYAATFEHLDGLGDPRLSLIEGVEIHELIRIVDAGDADPRADFLANDLADDAFLPDTLHLSGGGIEAVGAVLTGTVDAAPAAGRLEVVLNASFPPGWGYLRLPDPSGGDLALRAIRRPDGSLVPTDNFWVSDRTFIAGGRRPVYEHVLHLLDRDGPGTYTLVYDAPAPVDDMAPTSSVALLPEASTPRIPVSWSGADEPGGSGVDVFDVYVAIDRGPFEPWLRGTRATAATWLGEPGKAYAFYSVATDVAGNREEAPGSADASTFTSLTNRPPTLAAPAPVAVDEGGTVQVDLVASDPDEPLDRLTFRLGPGAPAGVQLNPVTGRLVWNTSEAIGPSVHRIPVEVWDDGIPMQGVGAEVAVEVFEVNAAPELDPVPDVRVGEGESVVLELAARDADLPANTLRFGLLGEPPAGASLDPVTGTFRWTPDSSQGGEQYVFGAEVTDNGTPPLSAVRYFTVVVDDVLPDFTLTASVGWALADVVVRHPIDIDSGQPLVAVDFDLELLGDPVPAPTLEATDPEVTGVAFQSLGDGKYRVGLTADPARPLQGIRELVRLVFPPADEPESAHVRIRISRLTGTRPTGTDPARGRAVNGYLVRVGDAPVLLAEFEEDRRVVTLFSLPGRVCDIEQRDVLTGGDGWRVIRTLVPTTTQTVLDDLDPDGFLRAVAGREPAPGLRLERDPDGTLHLRLDASVGAGWVLESAGAFGGPTGWTRVVEVPVGDPDWSRPVVPGEGARWYRLVRVPAGGGE